MLCFGQFCHECKVLRGALARWSQVGNQGTLNDRPYGHPHVPLVPWPSTSSPEIETLSPDTCTVLYCRARDHGCRCAEADILRRAHSRKLAYRFLQANSRLHSHNIPSAHHKIHTCTDTGNPKIFSNPQQQSSWHVHVPGVDACEPPPQSNHSCPHVA